MSTLTKEQKMEMVSQAIDAGFHVELKYFQIKTLQEFDEKLKPFTGLDFEMNSLDSESAYTRVNGKTGYHDKFEAIVFFE